MPRHSASPSVPQRPVDNPYAGRESSNLFSLRRDFRSQHAVSASLPVDVLVISSPLPYVQNWNLTIERKLAADWVLRLATWEAKPLTYDGLRPECAHLRFQQALQPEPGHHQPAPAPEYQNIYTMSTPFGAFLQLAAGEPQQALQPRIQRPGQLHLVEELDYDSSNNNTTRQPGPDPFNSTSHAAGQATTIPSASWVFLRLELPEPRQADGQQVYGAPFSETGR